MRASTDETGDVVMCPSCRSADLQRLLSLFSVSSVGLRRQHLQQARKLAQNETRDIKHAEMEAILHHDDH